MPTDTTSRHTDTLSTYELIEMLSAKITAHHYSDSLKMTLNRVTSILCSYFQLVEDAHK